ncbi:hypothetical protein ACJMK2_018194 [Sinanodonta woodiana]|uniref:Uncharacterized protein n=1 Tax=Sinanodonta woodiana TaxID=1069815 RepID=A0ABD3UCN9_SINWO
MECLCVAPAKDMALSNHTLALSVPDVVSILIDSTELRLVAHLRSPVKRIRSRDPIQSGHGLVQETLSDSPLCMIPTMQSAIQSKVNTKEMVENGIFTNYMMQ